MNIEIREPVAHRHRHQQCINVLGEKVIERNVISIYKILVVSK